MLSVESCWHRIWLLNTVVDDDDDDDKITTVHYHLMCHPRWFLDHILFQPLLSISFYFTWIYFSTSFTHSIHKSYCQFIKTCRIYNVCKSRKKIFTDHFSFNANPCFPVKQQIFYLFFNNFPLNVFLFSILMFLNAQFNKIKTVVRHFHY